MSRSIIRFFFVFFFVFKLCTTPSPAQNKRFIYADKNFPGSNVYVLSNRETIFQNNTTITTNNVKTETSLDFIKASIYSKDSLQIARSDSSIFFSELSSLKGNWVVFVHGDAKTLEESIWRGLDIKHLYNINVLIFSWPSRDPDLHGAKNFKRSQSHVSESSHHFRQVLEFVHLLRIGSPAFLNEQKISLFIHSLGNLYLKNMVKKDLHVGLSENLFDNLILNAAAVNQKNHKEWVEKINIQRHIYITSNKHDFNLKGARIFTKNGKQLGEKTSPPTASNAYYINLNKTVGFKFPTGATHTYFIGEMPEKNKYVWEFYHDILHGKNPNFINEKKYRWRNDNLSYEILSK